jgi:hypothetical protein
MVVRKSKAKLVQAVCLVVFVAIALIALVPAARSDGTALGGTIKGTGPITYFSPCNGAKITGTVNFTGVVSVFEEEGNSQVFVFVTYNAPNQTGTDGNTYNAHGEAVAAYDTLAPIGPAASGYYDLPMNLDYDVSTNNNKLNFLAGTHAFVDVDSTQRPTAVPDVGVNAVCGK